MSIKKWLQLMSDEKKDQKPLHPETNFLPPLKMFLAFFDKESRQKKKQQDSDEKKVEKLIEKLSEQEEGTSKKEERRD
jgi:hypothetical protein